MSNRSNNRIALMRRIGDSLEHGHIVATCQVTGIIFNIQAADLGAVGASLVSFASPFADITAVRKIIKANSLSGMSNSALAGFALCMAQHYKIIALQEMSASEGNAALSATSHSILCTLVRALNKIDSSGAAIIARRALPEMAESIEYCVKAWITDIIACLPGNGAAELEALAAESGITIISKDVKNKLTLAKAHQRILAKYEIPLDQSETVLNAQEAFKAARSEAKELWAAIQTTDGISSGLKATMKVLLQANNLNICNPALRAKLVTAITKIAHPQAQALARLVKDTYNPYDAFSSQNADAALEESDLTAYGCSTQKPKYKSIADMLAAKKAQANAPAEGQRQEQDSPKNSSSDNNSDLGHDSNAQNSNAQAPDSSSDLGDF